MATIYDRALQFLIEGNISIKDPTIEFIVTPYDKDPYRLQTVTINGETDIFFSKPMLDDYYITIKRYTTINGTIVEYG